MVTLGFFIVHFLIARRIKFYMKKIFNASLLILSSIIGVGFISGKEIYSFYARFGLSGLIFGMITGVLFAFCIVYFLNNSKNIEDIFYKEKTQNCEKLNEKCYQNDKNIKISAIFEKMLKVIYVIISAVMISGFRSLFLNFLPAFIVEILIFVMLFVLIFALQKEIKGIAVISKIFMLVFFIVFAVVFFSNTSLLTLRYVSGVNNLYCLCLVLFYVSMNIFTCFTLLIKVGKSLNKKQSIITGVVCGFFISIFIVLSVLLLSLSSDSVDMPILDISGSGVVGTVYVLVVVLGLVTTLFSTLYGAVIVGGKNGIKTRGYVIYFSYILSSFGFSSLINSVYPLLGFFTMLTLIVIVLVVKNRKMCKN